MTQLRISSNLPAELTCRDQVACPSEMRTKFRPQDWLALLVSDQATSLSQTANPTTRDLLRPQYHRLKMTMGHLRVDQRAVLTGNNMLTISLKSCR